MSFDESYVGQLRALVGKRMLMLPSLRAVLEDSEGRVLLQQRSDFGDWGLPGGSPELGDSMGDCILREVLEETGLEVVRYAAFGFASDPASEVVKFPNGDETHAFSLLVHVTEWRGVLSPTTDETVDLGFFAADALPAVHANHLRSVERFLEYRRTGEFQLY